MEDVMHIRLPALAALFVSLAFPAFAAEINEKVFAPSEVLSFIFSGVICDTPIIAQGFWEFTTDITLDKSIALTGDIITQMVNTFNEEGDGECKFLINMPGLLVGTIAAEDTRGASITVVHLEVTYFPPELQAPGEIFQAVILNGFSVSPAIKSEQLDPTFGTI
jgi:hypothetical protein